MTPRKSKKTNSVSVNIKSDNHTKKDTVPESAISFDFSVKDFYYFIHKFGPFLILLLLGIVSFFVVKPFFITVISAGLVAIIFFPFYKFIKKVLFKKRALASVLTVILIIALIIVPLIFTYKSLSKEVSVIFILGKQILSRGSPLAAECQDTIDKNFICRADEVIREFSTRPQVQYYLQNFSEKGQAITLNLFSKILSSLPHFLITFVLIFLMVFFFFKDSDMIMNQIRRFVPLAPRHRKLIFLRLNKIFYAIVYGNVITAFIQGCIGGFGLLILGYPSPILWGIMIIFAAFIPIFGTGLIYVPLSLMQIITGFAEGNNDIVLRGVLFLLYGMIIISNIDNIIRMKIIGDQTKIHPLIVLIGVFGGLIMFGFIGIFLGPLILAYFITFLEFSLHYLKGGLDNALDDNSTIITKKH